MGILNELLMRVRQVEDGLSDGSLIREAIEGYSDDIMAMQKEQLFAGKSSQGDDMRPYYSEDIQPGGYFKSKESAKRYANWKAKIPYPSKSSERRNPDAPNLYINGRFHSELDVVFDSDSTMVVGVTSYARGIVSKYGYEKFGLTKENWNKLFRECGAYDELMTRIKNTLYDGK